MISIIIPIHNGEKFIRRAINSVIAQRGEWELIVVNDHSTDRTQDILTEYAYGDKRIIIVCSQSKGVTDARMAGVSNASGEYLFFMDADDELPSNIIGEIEQAIETDKTLDLIISDIVEVRDNKVEQLNYGDISFSTGEQLFHWIIDNRTGFLWGKAIKKEVFESLDYVPSNLKFCEDYIQMLQLSLKARRIRHIGKAGYIYYQNPESVCNTRKSRDEYAAQFYIFASAIKDLIEQNYFKLEDGVYIMIRLKVMFLYYVRLYLAVAGRWLRDEDGLKKYYKNWMNDSNLLIDPLYDSRRRYQTKMAYYFPWILAAVYVPLLKFRYHRIK